MPSSMPSSQSVWNALLTVLGVALLACLGWQMSQIAELKAMAASRTAVEFTEEEAAQLRRDTTDVMTSIDIRLTLMERDIEWIKIIPTLRQAAQKLSEGDSGGDSNDDNEGARIAPIPMPQPSPDIRQEIQQAPRYDIRK